MRVAFVITRADAVGGASVHVRDVAAAAQARGIDVHVFVGGKPGPVTEQLSKHGVAWTIVPALGRAIRPWNDVRAVSQLAGMLKAYRPSIVSCHTSKGGLVGRLAAKMAGIPAVYIPHGWTIGDRLSPVAGRVFAAVERAVAPASARIVNVCEAERRLAASARVGAAEQMAVIHNGVLDVDPSLRAAAGGTNGGCVELVTVARMESPKDHATLLRALARVAALPWNFTWVGDGPLKKDALWLANELGLEDRIRFVGAAESAAQALAKAHVFVLSSRSEGFPRSILEALRAGLPVVASDVGGINESVSHRHNGLLFQAGQVADLAHHLRELICDADLRASMGARSRSRYESEFTFDQMMEATLRLWMGVLAQEHSVLSGRRDQKEPLLEGTTTR